MTFSKIQKDVDTWAKQFAKPYWEPLAILARVTEETGELAREINHSHGEKPKKASESKGDIGEEMADIIFALCCLANRLDVDLDQEWKKVMKKCYGRDNDRFERSA